MCLGALLNYNEKHYGPVIFMTWSIPKRPLHSHSLVCNKNRLFIIGIGPIRYKEHNFFIANVVIS